MLNEIFAREILETSIALGILQEMNGGIVIYHEASKEDPENLPAGWYIDDKDYTTFSIANDPEAVKCLKAPLKKGGYNFEERKEFWDSFFDFKAPKLRLPVEITKPSGKDGIAQRKKSFMKSRVFAVTKRKNLAVTCSSPVPKLQWTSSTIS